ncbi:MAG: DJ-1 family protein [Spirochaetae bacterium HGW-Spirochaetae-6]|nr:MAG: DJ-1 family protein [Spirochaetae bacterium HGW-Spirochaetae-6]
MPRTTLLLADGFEEIETMTIVDVLRRADISVALAGLDLEPKKGSHGVFVLPEISVDDIKSENYQMLILPGGQPGTNHLMADLRVLRLIREFHQSNKYLAAICAAPMVLAKAGVLGEKEATCYPGCEKGLGQAKVLDKKVVQSNNIITSRGPATAFCFALLLVEILRDKATADQVGKGLLLPPTYCRE